MLSEQIRNDQHRWVMMEVVRNHPLVHQIEHDKVLDHARSAGFVVRHESVDCLSIHSDVVDICDPQTEWQEPVDYRRDPKKLWIGRSPNSTVTHYEVIVSLHKGLGAVVNWSYQTQLAGSILTITYKPMVKVGNVLHSGSCCGTSFFNTLLESEGIREHTVEVELDQPRE